MLISTVNTSPVCQYEASFRSPSFLGKERSPQVKVGKITYSFFGFKIEGASVESINSTRRARQCEGLDLGLGLARLDLK